MTEPILNIIRAYRNIRGANTIKKAPEFFRGLFAVYWLTKATKQGYVGAMYNLSDMYYSGKGVPVDFKKAKKWYKKAYNSEDEVSQYIMDLFDGYKFKRKKRN